MISKMQGERVSTTSSHAIALEELIENGVRETPDVAAIASRSEKQLAMMIWHYHDDDVIGANASVELVMNGLPTDLQSAEFTHYRVDQFHSNAYDLWRRMGSPAAPDAKQYADLESASQLATLHAAESINIKDGKATLTFTLPRQGVSLIVLEHP